MRLGRQLARQEEHARAGYSLFPYGAKIAGAVISMQQPFPALRTNSNSSLHTVSKLVPVSVSPCDNGSSDKDRGCPAWG